MLRGLRQIFILSTFLFCTSCSEESDEDPDFLPPSDWRDYSIELPENYGVWGISFINDTTGWISVCRLNQNPPVLVDRRILKTNDGGMTWNLVNEGSEIEPNGSFQIHFFDKQNGVLIGFNGFGLNQYWYETKDGGVSFENLGRAESIFTDGNTVWMISETRLFRSRDGEKWELLFDGFLGDRVFFLDTQKAITDHQLVSEDGGRTWDHAGIGLTDSEKSNFYHNMVFSDLSTGYACKYFGSKLLMTSDGGETWENVPEVRSAVDILRSTDGAIHVGGKGSYFVKSENSDWEEKQMGADVTIYELYEAPNGDLWMTGDRGVIFCLKKH